MQELKVIEFEGKRVLTTQQLAQCYETTRQIISNNFTRNKSRYTVGKHYIPLEGKMLQDFKTCHQFDDSMKRVSILYLWTEKGALLHAKSLNTDKAWEVYDYLVDFYFRVKTQEQQEEKPKEAVTEGMRNIPLKGVQSAKGLVVDVPENKEALKLVAEMRKYMAGMEALLDLYVMYHTEEEFKKIAYTVQVMGGKISRAALFLYTLKPRVVEKFL